MNLSIKESYSMKIHGSLNGIINIKCYNQQKELAIRLLIFHLDYLVIQGQTKKNLQDQSVKTSFVCLGHIKPLNNMCLSSVHYLTEASISTI